MSPRQAPGSGPPTDHVSTATLDAAAAVKEGGMSTHPVNDGGTLAAHVPVGR